MKLQRLDWCKGTQKLIPFIASGQLRSEFTEPFIHGTYLEAWWRCLKFSKEFIQSSRTGIFTSKASYDTFCMFGPLEDMSFKDWWLKKGHELFSSSITTLQVTLFVRRKNAKIYSVSVNAFQDVSTRLAAQEFGFWLDQILLLNTKEGLLSEAPLAWPIFKSRISYEVISQLLSIMEIHDQIIRNAPNTKLWQIGEQLGLNPQAMPKVSDYPKETEEKHRRMGQTVSSYLIKGKGLVDNAYKGAFPKYSN